MRDLPNPQVAIIPSSEAKYRALFESARDAIFLLQGGTFVDCNAWALRLYGADREHIIGQGPWHFSPEHQPDGQLSTVAGQARIARALAGEAQLFEWQHRRDDGTLFEVEVSLNRVDLPEGPLVMAVARDITDYKRAATENARLLHDLRERVKELTALYAITRLVQQDQGTHSELLRAIVQLLPLAWQYPEITVARLRFANAQAQTDNFTITPWLQRVEFVTTNGQLGLIEVVYLEERLPEAEGPFLAEERQLINSLAEMLRLHFERKRAEAALQQRVRELATLHELAQALKTMTDVRETCRVLVEKIAAVIGARRCLAVLRETDGYVYPQSPAYGIPDQELSRWVTPQADETARRNYIRHGFLLADSPEAVAQVAQLRGSQEVQADNLLMIPLIADDDVLGHVILLDKFTGFQPDDIQLAGVFASQAAAVIQNARLYQAERIAREQAEALRAASLTITHSLDFNVVLQSVLEQLRRVVPYDSACVFLLEKDSHVIIHATAGYEQWSASADLFRGQRFGLSELPGLQAVMTTHHGLLIPDTNTHPEWVRVQGAEYVQSWIGIPLMAEGQVFGAYSLDSARPGFFSEAHLHWAEGLAAQGAIAIQNARLFAQVRTGREHLQALSQRLVDVQEEERRHLARELHDEVGQMLTGLKLMLSVIPRLPPADIAPKIGEVLALLNSLTERVHDLSLDLRPMMLDDFGLTSALLWLFDRYTAQTGVQVQFESLGLEGRLPPTVETTAYRLVQEALTNVARYAGVSVVQVRVRVETESMRLEIYDAGQGFEVEAALASGERTGLAGMRERVTLLGGWLTIYSAPGTGTHIVAILPLHGRLERRKRDRLNPAV